MPMPGVHKPLQLTKLRRLRVVAVDTTMLGGYALQLNSRRYMVNKNEKNGQECNAHTSLDFPLLDYL